MIWGFINNKNGGGFGHMDMILVGYGIWDG